MINKFLARTMYNLWVALKHSQGSVIADSLKLYAMMTLVISFIPDAEEGKVIK